MSTHFHKLRIHIILTVLLCCLSSLVDAQGGFEIDGPKNLIYFVDAQDNKNQYLLPFLERELILLKFNAANSARFGLSQDSANMFLHVNNLDILNSRANLDKKFSSLLQFFGREKPNYSNNTNTRLMSGVDSLIGKELIRNDLILRININILGTLIEYQFILFRAINDSPNTRVYPDVRTYRSVSVFVDPTNQDYIDKLRIGLHQLFVEAKEPPTPVLLIDSRIAETENWVEIGKSIKLESFLIDPDAQKDRITYHWLISDSQSNTIISHPTDVKQTWQPQHLGDYNLTIKVNDGIKDSSRTFTFHIVEKPSLEIAGDISSVWNYYDNSINFYSFHRQYRSDDFYPEGIDLNRPHFRIQTIPIKDQQLTIRIFSINGVPNLDSVERIAERRIQRTRLPIDDQYYYALHSHVDTLTRQSDSMANLQKRIYTLIPAESGTRISGGITTPSTDYLQVKVSEHGIENSEIIKIRYHRVHRLGFFLEEGVIFGAKDSVKTGLLLPFLGIQYLLSSVVTLKFSIGTAQGDTSIRPTLSESLMECAELQATIFKTQNWCGYLSFFDNYHPVYLVSGKQTTIQRSNSFGFSLDVGTNKLKSAIYGELQPEFFVAYYPKWSGASGGVGTGEVGIRVNLLTLKR